MITSTEGVSAFRTAPSVSRQCCVPPRCQLFLTTIRSAPQPCEPRTSNIGKYCHLPCIMATPITKQSLTRSPSAGRKLSHDALDLPPTDEKYNRLEDLLRQTLGLAGEIAETSSQRQYRTTTTLPARHTHVPGECIVLRKTSQTVSEPTIELGRRSSSRHPRRKSRLPVFNDSEEGSVSASVAPSMQEPFSPGSLAMSLDAVVEGERSDDQVCFENPASLADTLPESTPLSRVTTSQERASTRSQTPGSMLGHESMSESVSAVSAPIPIPGKPRCRPSASHRNSSQGPRAGEEPPSPPPKWHVRIVPVAFNRDPILPSSPPRTPAPPAFVKLEAVFPYRFFSDGNAAARWCGEGSYIIIGRPPVDEHQSPLNLDECEQEFGPATERCLGDFIDEWECSVDETAGQGEVHFG